MIKSWILKDIYEELESAGKLILFISETNNKLEDNVKELKHELMLLRFQVNSLEDKMGKSVKKPVVDSTENTFTTNNDEEEIPLVGIEELIKHHLPITQKDLDYFLKEKSFPTKRKYNNSHREFIARAMKPVPVPLGSDTEKRKYVKSGKYKTKNSVEIMNGIKLPFNLYIKKAIHHNHNHEDGSNLLKKEDIRQRVTEVIANLVNSGNNGIRVAEITGLTYPQVCMFKQKANDQGLIK